MSITGSSVLLKQFCLHRWVENVAVSYWNLLWRCGQMLSSMWLLWNKGRCKSLRISLLVLLQQVVEMPDLKLKPTFSCQSLMKGPIFLTDTRQTCKKRFSEKDIFSVKADTKTLVIALVKKLLLKAPIRYGLVRNMAWLHPLEICCDQERCLEHLGRCLRIVSDAPQIKLSSSGRNKKNFSGRTQPTLISNHCWWVTVRWLCCFMTAWPMLLTGLICGS